MLNPSDETVDSICKNNNNKVKIKTTYYVHPFILPKFEASVFFLCLRCVSPPPPSDPLRKHTDPYSNHSGCVLLSKSRLTEEDRILIPTEQHPEGSIWKTLNTKVLEKKKSQPGGECTTDS